MTPKEKAISLVEKYQGGYVGENGFNYVFNNDFTEAVQCAIIAVDEILSLPSQHEGRMIVVMEEDYKFWKDVRQELLNL